MKWSEVSYDGKKKIERRWQVCVADAMGKEWFDEPIKRSGVTFNFAFDIADYLRHAHIMPYPEKLFQINSRYNPHAYYLGRKLVDHYNQKQGKKNGNRILVSTLLKCLPDLPKYEDTENVFQLIMSLLIGILMLLWMTMEYFVFGNIAIKTVLQFLKTN